MSVRSPGTVTSIAEDRPATGLSRRERRKHEVKERIIAAAISLFDEQGFADTTVAEIADRADVARKTFFNYFPSKQDVLRDVAMRMLDIALTAFAEATAAPGSTRDRLKLLFSDVADQCDSAGPMRKELLTELVHVAHTTGTEAEQAQALQDAFGALLRKGRAQDDVCKTNPLRTQTELVLGSYYALMFNWANFDGYPIRRQGQAMAQMLGDALCVPMEDSSS